MSPLVRAFFLLSAGQIAGQVASAMVQARLDPVGAGGPQGSVPVGGGATRNDDIAMVGGSAGGLYLAAKQKNPSMRIFLIGASMGFIAPVTQALAAALAQRVVGNGNGG